MTLNFSTHWPEKMGPLAGMPTYFPEKIIRSLDIPLYKQFTEHDFLSERLNPTPEEFEQGLCNPMYDFAPKLHTIRRGHRWEKGMKIHFVIFNRTKDRYQFAMGECTGVQDIRIVREEWETRNVMIPMKNIYVDGRPLYPGEKMDIAINDGFPSVLELYDFFNEDFDGQIIHWTDMRY